VEDLRSSEIAAYLGENGSVGESPQVKIKNNADKPAASAIIIRYMASTPRDDGYERVLENHFWTLARTTVNPHF
jgi:hypothetical protein